jgi:hypothetical protein
MYGRSPVDGLAKLGHSSRALVEVRRETAAADSAIQLTRKPDAMLKRMIIMLCVEQADAAVGLLFAFEREIMLLIVIASSRFGSAA